MNLLRFSVYFILSLFLIVIGACRKSNDSPSCNDVVMKLKRIAATYDDSEYLDAEWNADGSIKLIRLNGTYTFDRNATYIYQNGRIKESVMRYNGGNTIDDTTVFRYNTQGMVDSVYQKHDDNQNVKLDYSNGKLVKFTGYDGKDAQFYWDVTMDSNGNIIKGVEYVKRNSVYQKERTYEWTRDDRKNPLKDLAVYMLNLDDAYNIFWYWGANNYTDQRYIDHSGTGIDIVSGDKFEYNENCYPKSSKSTVGGKVLINEDSWLFTYY